MKRSDGLITQIRNFRLPAVTLTIGKVEANLGSGFILICGIMGLLKAADCRHNKHSSSTTSIVVVRLSGAVLQAISTIAHESGHYFASRLLGIKVNGVGVDFLRAYVSVEFPENSKTKPAIGIL